MDNSNFNTNPELLLADDFVCHTNHNIFLTGKAGTGKTTFLQNLKSNINKRLIITAPTGVATTSRAAARVWNSRLWDFTGMLFFLSCCSGW